MLVGTGGFWLLWRGKGLGREGRRGRRGGALFFCFLFFVLGFVLLEW